jgi:hypothetical protein
MIAGWITVGMVVLGFCLGLVPRLAIVLSWVFAVLGLVVLALHVIGSGLCMLVPGKRNGAARGLAIAAFTCTALVVVSCSILQVMALTAGGMGMVGPANFAIAGLAGILALASPALWLAGDICWMLFLRLLALQCRYDDLARQIVGFMVATGVYFVVMILYYVLVGAALISAARGAAAMGGRGGQPAGLGGGMICFGLLGLLLWIVGFGGYIWYIVRLLTPVRDLVNVKLRRG